MAGTLESGWANSTDVVRNHYGEQAVNEKFGGQNTTSGLTKEIELIFSYDDLPTFGTGELETLIPANAFIKTSKLEVITAFAGGTSYNLGLYEQDGTVVDADGIDAGVLLAALTPAGAWIDNNGALVGAGLGSAAAQIVVAATGTFTAGKARLVIEYYDSKT